MSTLLVHRHPRSYSCSVCSSSATRSDKHDAFYCALCDAWLEGRCAGSLDGSCNFCFGRPDKPSQVER